MQENNSAETPSPLTSSERTMEQAVAPDKKPTQKKFHMGCTLKGILIALGLVLVLYIFRAPMLRGMGHWLDRSDKIPAHADLIYVFAGGENERPQLAARLLKQGLAPVIVTGGGQKTDKLKALGMNWTEAEVNREVLLKNGAPADKIATINEGTSTWEEARLLRRYMVEHKLRTAILVTSNFHTRRVKMCLRKVCGGDGLTFFVVSPTEHPLTNLDAWWKNEEDYITVENEYMKLLYYTIKY